MDEPRSWVATTDDELDRAAVLLHAFNVEYDDPTPEPSALAARLAWLHRADDVIVLLAAPSAAAQAQGVAVMRLQPSVWSEAFEAYLAELFVSREHRGRGMGRALLEFFASTARERGADYAFVVTSADDVSAQHAYRSAGFRRTEGEGGPELLAFERDL